MAFSYAAGFVAEGYTDGDDRWNDAQPLQLEAKDTWYCKHFYNQGTEREIQKKSWQEGKVIRGERSRRWPGPTGELVQLQHGEGELHHTDGSRCRAPELHHH